ncbi:hypothetical protein [Frigidibacter sp. ROC022]|uniref:hypothetical protein n=1 Tax=Frigidibacter sp. ROC022 TaxID=2971796 RepID=UPI00215B548D|nr:hypothetical protein [Frigidibacter sp. ROC022]MCR8725813.1 hypothetical protein [Frigidibacter sp. ROC022]
MSKIFTAAALDGRSIPELRALFRKAHEEMVASEAGSVDRRNAIASIENIGRAIAQRSANTPTI